MNLKKLIIDSMFTFGEGTRPVIGITVDCKQDPDDPRSGGKLTLNWNYAEAVTLAGGVPILIPPTADMEVISKIIHGLLIPGGDDIDACRFGEQNHSKVELQDPARFEAESRLFAKLPEDLPIFGICYGAQFINVVRGGTLIQHLPDVVGHEAHTGGTLQSYAVDPRSKLSKAIECTEMSGKSYHHQAVKDLGTGLKVVATNEDGTIEAIEATDRPWMVGVQWHPERTLEDEATKKLFQDFIKAAHRFANVHEKVC